MMQGERYFFIKSEEVKIAPLKSYTFLQLLLSSELA